MPGSAWAHPKTLQGYFVALDINKAAKQRFLLGCFDDEVKVLGLICSWNPSPSHPGVSYVKVRESEKHTKRYQSSDFLSKEIPRWFQNTLKIYRKIFRTKCQFSIKYKLAVYMKYFSSLQFVNIQFMCESIPAASIPPPPPRKPREFHARWVPAAGHLEVFKIIVFQSPGHFSKQTKNCFVTSRRHFRRCSESRVSNTVILKFICFVFL